MRSTNPAGSIDVRKDGSVWARVWWRDEELQSKKYRYRQQTKRVIAADGKPLHVSEPADDRQRRRAKNRGKETLRQLQHEVGDELRKTGGASLRHREKTFTDLANLYEKRYVVPAQYDTQRGGRVTKTRGMRPGPLETVTLHLAMWRRVIGERPVREITFEDLAELREQREDAPTIAGRKRSQATVNREMSLLRTVFKFGKRSRWILNDPFEDGDALIKPKLEHSRERVLSVEEEARLLAGCDGLRAHLRPIVICAIETGMRRGEILQLKWSDVDLGSRTIHIRAITTKTLKPRTVGITARLLAVLLELPQEPGLVFPIDNSQRVHRKTGTMPLFKRAFRGACKAAGIDDFRFHDLRHTFATRAEQRGASVAQLRLAAGWSPASRMDERYVNDDGTAGLRIAALFDSAAAVN